MTAEEKSFSRSVLERFRANYGSPHVGLLILRRLLEAPAESDLSDFVREVGQSRIVAEEFGMSHPGSIASAAQKKVYIADIKAKVCLIVKAVAESSKPVSPSALFQQGATN